MVATPHALARSASVQTKQQPRILERLDGTTNQKKRKGEARRIETIGKLDDRHRRALAVGDRAALIELAGEYMTLGKHGGCPHLANVILEEAEGLQ